MKRFIKKIALYILVLYISTSAFALLLDELYYKSQIFKPAVISNLDTNKNYCFIMGASRTLTGINTAQLKKKSGDNWLNISADDTPIEIHNMMLAMLKERGIQINKIVLAFDRYSTDDVDKYASYNNYRFLPFINKYDAVDEYFSSHPKYLLYKYLPISKYLQYNTELIYPAVMLLYNSGYRHRFDENGDVSYPDDGITEGDSITFNQQKFVEHDEFKKFRASCKDDSIALYPYIAPLKGTYINTDGTDIINFTDSLKNTYFFTDNTHIKSASKDTVTNMLYRAIYK